LELKYQQQKGPSWKVRWRQTRQPQPTRIAPLVKGHDNASNDMIKECFWMSRGAARAKKCTPRAKECATRASSFLFFFIFFICSNTKLHLSWLDNNEKNYCEKIKKKPLNVIFKNFAFKIILVVSLYFFFWSNTKFLLN